MEVPQCSNCCFFIPLKPGLLTLAYINLIIHGALFVLAAFVSFYITVISLGFGGEFPPVEFSLLLPLVTISFMVFYILVIVASHKENTRLLRVSLIFGTALFVFVALYSICIVYRLGSILNHSNVPDKVQLQLGGYITFVVLEPFILGYSLLLVRSLKLKLGGEDHGTYLDLARFTGKSSDYEPILP